ncbi:hypothetical protein CTR2_R28440 [Comamonas thiooxydans]|uniref:hypothetical protein n=1 Tax=Comamonas thiooxydans TaxID=363952 RepID=UPI0011205927|nr:hypothetical protein [Comamonas thiooxydans]BDR09506.1 hypothetical protein CTR2_R28440 [Comamonas thiooxydans]
MNGVAQGRAIEPFTVDGLPDYSGALCSLDVAAGVVKMACIESIIADPVPMSVIDEAVTRCLLHRGHQLMPAGSSAARFSAWAAVSGRKQRLHMTLS